MNLPQARRMSNESKLLLEQLWAGSWKATVIANPAKEAYIYFLRCLCSEAKASKCKWIIMGIRAYYQRRGRSYMPDVIFLDRKTLSTWSAKHLDNMSEGWLRYLESSL